MTSFGVVLIIFGALLFCIGIWWYVSFKKFVKNRNKLKLNKEIDYEKLKVDILQNMQNFIIESKEAINIIEERMKEKTLTNLIDAYEELDTFLKVNTFKKVDIDAIRRELRETFLFYISSSENILDFNAEMAKVILEYGETTTHKYKQILEALKEGNYDQEIFKSIMDFSKDLKTA